MTDISTVQRTKVYDLPTRLFHWFFAAFFLAAFLVAKNIDDESPAFTYHMMLGLTLAFAVILRIFWGFVGSKYARFSSFALNPKEVIQYFKALITGKTIRTLGHNPASSWIAVIMMGLALTLALSGYKMTTGGDKDSIKEIHELFANGFLVAAILHVLGVFFHSVKHKDSIWRAMIDGKKDPVDGQTGIAHSYRVIGLLFILLLGAFAINLVTHYDPKTLSLSLFGKTLQLGDPDHQSRHEKKHEDD